MKRLIICIACFIISLNAQSETPTFKNAQDFVASISKSGEKVTYDTIIGDLNNDGLSDLAIMLHTINGTRSGYQVVVLLGTQDNSFSVWKKSKFLDSSDGTVAKLKKIRRGSLFVYVEALRGFWGTYQFKSIDNTMSLIGATIHTSSCRSDQDNCLAVDTDINFLTGDITFEDTNLGIGMPKKRQYRDRAHFTHCDLSNFSLIPDFCMENIRTSKGMLDDRMRGDDQPSSAN